MGVGLIGGGIAKSERKKRERRDREYRRYQEEQGNTELEDLRAENRRLKKKLRTRNAGVYARPEEPTETISTEDVY